MAAAQLIVQVEVRIAQVGAGTGAVLVEQNQSNNPGQGQSQIAIAMPTEQFMYFQDAEQVYGTAGSVTLAQINTALTAAVATIAGSTGTPLISTANLATINAWQTGSP